MELFPATFPLLSIKPICTKASTEVASKAVERVKYRIAALGVPKYGSSVVTSWSPLLVLQATCTTRISNTGGIEELLEL